MAQQHSKIIQNDKKIIEILNERNQLFIALSGNLLDEIELLESNVKLRQSLTGDVNINLDNDKLVNIQNAFPKNVISNIGDTRDDNFMIGVLSKMSLSPIRSMQPVVSKPRGLYINNDDTIIMLRKTAYNENWSPNSIGFNITENLEDLVLFNNTDYLVIARYESGGAGYKDYAVFDISKLIFTKYENKIMLGGVDEAKSFDIVIGNNPYFYFRTDNIVEPILIG